MRGRNKNAQDLQAQTYKKAKMEIMSLYGTSRKKKAKPEPQEEKPKIRRFYLSYDFCIIEDKKPKVYAGGCWLPEKAARKEKDRLYDIYEAALLDGRVIYFERCGLRVVESTD